MGLVYYFSRKKKTANFTNIDGAAYNTLADGIYAAENGCNDDAQSVIDILSHIRTADEYRALVQAFGQRPRNPCWITHPIDALVSQNPQSMDLQQYLEANLNDADMATVRQIQAGYGGAISYDPWQSNFRIGD